MLRIVKQLLDGNWNIIVDQSVRNDSGNMFVSTEEGGLASKEHCDHSSATELIWEQFQGSGP